MKKVFVCSPLRGDVVTNLKMAKAYCRSVALRGIIPIAPHVYFTQFLDDAIKEERELGIAMGIELMKDCDEMWVFGTAISSGMAQEIGWWVVNKGEETLKYINL